MKLSKSIKNVILIVLLIIVLAFSVSYINEGTAVFDNLTNKKNLTQSESNEICINYVGEFKEKDYRKLSKQIDMLPKGVKRSFCNRNWTIEVIGEVDNKKEELYKNLICVGTTEYSDKKIYITPNTETGLVHEMGHYTAYVCCFSEYTSEFQGIYHDEAEKLAEYMLNHDRTEEETDYITSNIREYYADSFRYLVLNPEINKVIPKTADYIKNDIDKLNSQYTK